MCVNVHDKNFFIIISSTGDLLERHKTVLAVRKDANGQAQTAGRDGRG